MSTSTKEQFEQAIADLKEINDELFYDDLKLKMNTHMDRLEVEYEKVAQNAREVHDYLGRYEYTIQKMTQEVENQLRVTMNGTKDQLEASFDEQKETPAEAYGLFLTIGEEQRSLIEAKEVEWSEFFKRLIEEQHAFIVAANTEWQKFNHEAKDQQQAVLDQLVSQFDSVISRMAKENNEVVNAQREKLTKEVGALLHNLERQWQHMQTQFDGVLTHFQQSHENHKIRTESLIRQFVQETKEQFQVLQIQMDDVKNLVLESSEETRQKLAKEQASFQIEWKKREEKLEEIQKQQSSTMKKWLVGLTVSNILVIAGVVGLYLF